MGDFNINMINHNNDANARKLGSIFHSINFYNVITKPTRVTGTSATLIDHIWTNDYNHCKNNGILYDETSDHFPVFSFFVIKLMKIKLLIIRRLNTEI